MKHITITTIVLLALMAGGVATAQYGPVGRACVADIAKYCAGLRHGRGEVRNCLEAHYKDVSAKCQHALDTTGRGMR